LSRQAALLSFILLLSLIGLAPSSLSADGSLFGTAACPVPAITGIPGTLVLPLQGPPPPDGAVITKVTGSCAVDGRFPVTTLSTGGRSIGVKYHYYSETFTGLPASSVFVLTMLYPGDYGVPTGAKPGICTINVSWTVTKG
jgi:hypothetical protein